MSIFKELIQDPDVLAQVDELHSSTVTSTVDTEVKGLKSKNKELLDESKQALKKFTGLQETIGDLDVSEARKAFELVNSEEGKLLLGGKKLEEAVELATSTMKADHEAKLGEVSSLNNDNKTKKNKWRTKYKNKTIDDTIRNEALKAKVRPEALEDVVSRGRKLFSVAEDDTVEARGSDGNLVKIGELIATPKNWVESLKKDAPHYWPGSQGAGFTGDGEGGGDDLQSQLLLAAKNKNMPEYRRITALIKKRKEGN